MILTKDEQALLDGKMGEALSKAMQILVALGKIYHAENMVPITSAQIAGVSYDNLGEDGLDFLNEMAVNGDRVRVLTTLNPAGMDIENWRALGITADFAEKQIRVIDAFKQMGIIPTCSCTPYLVGNLPLFGDHIAWAESSAVCFANSIIGARTNREGGPSALAAALTGRTPAYGLHLNEGRLPTLHVEIPCDIQGETAFGALGAAYGLILEGSKVRHVPIFTGISRATLDELKAFSASIATYAGTALFHIRDITPEANRFALPDEHLVITLEQVEQALVRFSTPEPVETDFYTLGCPHLSLNELIVIAKKLAGKKVKKEFWLTTARPTKEIAQKLGIIQIIEETGAKVVADTCCVVAPIGKKYHTLATNSAKGIYYASSKHHFHTRFLTEDQIIAEVTR